MTTWDLPAARPQYTLFFYKNLFYNNVVAEIDPDVKNNYDKNVPNLRLRDKAFLFICIELKTRSNSMNLYRVTFSFSKYSRCVLI